MLFKSRRAAIVLAAAALAASPALMGFASANAASSASAVVIQGVGQKGVCPYGNPVVPSKSGSKVHYSATASCSKANGLAGVLYHYYAPPIPDAKVWTAKDYTGPSFSVSNTLCDGGGTTTYYTQADVMVDSGDSISNSANVVIHDHC